MAMNAGGLATAGLSAASASGDQSFATSLAAQFFRQRSGASSAEFSATGASGSPDVASFTSTEHLADSLGALLKDGTAGKVAAGADSIIQKVMGQSSVVSGAVAGSLATNLPAQWVLLGGLVSSGTDSEAQPDRSSVSDVEALEGLDSLEADSLGIGGHAGDVGHRHHAGRSVNSVTEAIDLTAEGRSGASGPDPDGAAERLSQRLAEGIAQRMLAAVSSNNWKLQIDLKPAHLGHVSVEMTMQHGRLEAVFDAGQASARSLISDGLDRLRQDLQRAGMNVAHLGLNFGTGAGTGGKSTPRGRDAQEGDGTVGRVQEAGLSPTVRQSRTGPDGLDVMV